jgi:hypothetical protein
MRRFYTRYGMQLICDAPGCGDTWDDESWANYAVDDEDMQANLVEGGVLVGWWVRTDDNRAFCEKHNPDYDIAGNKKKPEAILDSNNMG